VSRWFAFAPLIVLAALAVLFAGYALHHDPHVNPAALVGRQAPAVALQPLAGGAPAPLRTPAQGPVLVSFFASWCAPCVEDAPALMALKAEGVPIIGVAYKDAPSKSQAFLAANGNPFISTFMDPSGRAGVDFGVSGVPETFAIGADGRVLAKRSGPLSPSDAEALVEALGR
jgi:cytochrome c biogenesis protein CcmG/thiol:disulfide interchange protein DsbE